MKRHYIAMGCDQQGRALPTFLDQPQRHTITRRNANTAVDDACAIHGVRKGRHATDFVLVAIVVLVCALVACDVIPLG